MWRAEARRTLIPSMDYGTFLGIVERQAQVGRDEAEQATRATLETLAERLSNRGGLDQGENRQLVAQLPLEMAPWLLSRRGPEQFDADEFLRRIAKREDTDVEVAEVHARAVFAALRKAITRAELKDILADLPDDFRPLVLNLHVPTVGELVDGVVERAGIEEAIARKALGAVLETLAKRIPAGQVRDLMGRLPLDLHDDLKRGGAASDGQAHKMPAAEFARRVAEREGTTVDEAVPHIRAVLSAVREAVGAEEFSDIVVEFPTDYTPLLPEP
jgi:uncharacterized protein (DUF2267 family)